MPEGLFLVTPVGSRKELIEAAADFRTRKGAAEYIDDRFDICCGVTLVFEAA